MSFISINFYAFCLLLVILYYLVPKRMQLFVLLVFNAWFILASSGALSVFMLITVLTTYGAGRVMNRHEREFKEQAAAIPDITRQQRRELRAVREKRNRRVLLAAMFLNFGIWAVIKYTDFFIQNVNKVRAVMGIPDVPYAHFIMPLGISFYTFAAMGYLIDVSRGKYPADESLLNVAVFVTFFPHLIEGPFSRYDTLGKSLLQAHNFDYENIACGARRILWGLCKKVIIADQLGIAVDTYFGNLKAYTGPYACAAMLLYAMQLYADFSGYMDIACGVSRLLGVKLDENFARPFLSVSVEDFWRRWHITLGTWFRDYVFYPVSLGKAAQKLGHKSRKKFGPRMGKLVPSYLALIFVWVITGLWHGAAWQYVFWGLANLFIIVFSMQMKPLYDRGKALIHADRHPGAWRVFMVIRTFIIVGFLRVMSRTAGFRQCLMMYKNVFRGWEGGWLSVGKWTFFPKMQTISIVTACFFSLLLILVDIFEESGKWEAIKGKTPGFVRALVYALLLAALVICAGETAGTTTGFMYEIY